MMPDEQQGGAAGAFNFRVSDVVDVPLRGTKLRLRLVDGSPTMKQLKVGSGLVLQSPAGEEQRVEIVAHTTSVGRATQQRLERSRELDVIVTEAGSKPGVRIPAEIGWFAIGPV
jgi:hypothetical protein